MGVFSPASAQSDDSAFDGYSLGMSSSMKIQNALFPYKTDLKLQSYRTGIESSIIFSKPLIKEHLLSHEIALVKKALFSMETNIPQYLRSQDNKRAALRNHIVFLNKLLVLLKQRSYKIKKELAQLDIQNKRNESIIASSEKEFFRALNQFEVNLSADRFDVFVESSQSNIQIRAYLGAFHQIDEWYQNLIPQLEKLIFAIEENKEALVQGITVTDIENIDLGIIRKIP